MGHYYHLPVMSGFGGTDLADPQDWQVGKDDTLDAFFICAAGPELLPGLGKKTMWAIIEERKKSLFESFEDLETRVTSLHKPDQLIARRIEDELSDPDQKYHLFVAR